MKPSRATLLSSALLLLLWTLALSCQSAVVEPPPAKGLAAPSRVRRLTQEELNRTLVDLFPAVVVPAITIIEDNGKDFAQLVAERALENALQSYPNPSPVNENIQPQV